MEKHRLLLLLFFDVLLDSTCVPQNLKYYLPLLCEVIFETSLERDGVIIPHEEVISLLEADTLSAEACLGEKGRKFTCGSFPQIVMLQMQVEREKYEKDVKLLREILYQTKFEGDRLKVVAKRMNNTISKYKQKGNSVMTVLLRSLLFTPDCNHQVNSMLRQGKFLEGLLRDWNQNQKPSWGEMEELRALLTSPDNLTVHMAADVAQLTLNGKQPHEVWLKTGTQQCEIFK